MTAFDSLSMTEFVELAVYGRHRFLFMQLKFVFA
jgi:hypothetical protein